MEQNEQSPQRDFHDLLYNRVRVREDEWPLIAQEIPLEALLGEIRTSDLIRELTRRQAEAAPAIGATVMQNEIVQSTSQTDEVVVDIEALPFGEQLKNAYKGYKAVLEDLNALRFSNDEDPVEVASEEQVAVELAQWLTEDRREYIQAVQNAVSPEETESSVQVAFTLVATPNIAVTSGELIGLADAFAAKQPQQPMPKVESGFYEKYNLEELSPPMPETDNVVVFSLVPAGTSPEITGTVAQQRELLSQAQENDSFSRVPRPLEAVSHWYVRREGGEQLHGEGTHELTYVRHFDLSERSLGFVGAKQVPCTYIDNEGTPVLGYSDLREGEARLVIG